MGGAAHQTELEIDGRRPFFAELPYYLWGAVNYGSEGDCKRPTDREWTSLEICNRETQDFVYIEPRETTCLVSGVGTIAVRSAMFLHDRCGAGALSESILRNVGDWNHAAGVSRAERVATEFSSPKLAIFDSHLFWGIWKWIGAFATEFTWVGRMIMHSVLYDDPRGVPLCVDWLRQGTSHPDQSLALRLALGALTGEALETDRAWLKWYDGGMLRAGAKARYPEPDIEAWVMELRAQYAD